MKKLIFTILFILILTIFSFGQGQKPITDLDSFSNNISWNDEKLRLSNFVIELEEKNNVLFYIVISTENPKSKKLVQRRARITNYLIEELKLNKEKIKVVVTKSPFEETQYWIVPKGAEPPEN